MAAKKTKSTSGEGGKGEYVVFARRFRPQTFEDVVGQQVVTRALRHALKTGRLAQAYLLTGPRGVGKTSLARIFAKALNCLKGQGPDGQAEEPCNACEACVSIGEGSSLDVIEMDAATNRGIADVQKLRENVGLAPSHLRAKVYIVDEIHMLTTEAWNAFLKTLEEPPRHVKFVFATTDPDRIPETILSRCQRFDLRRISLGDIVKRLRQICEVEAVEAETGALERIAALAKGGLRDAESLLDLAVNLGQGKVDAEVVRQISGAAPDELLLEILHACADGKVAEALAKAGGALEAGADPDDLLVELSGRVRGALLAKTCGTSSPLLEGQSHLAEEFGKLGAKLNEDQLLMLLQLFGAARRQVRDAAQARLPLEMALVRAARIGELVELGKLIAAVEQGAAGPPGGGPRGAPRPNSPGRPAGVTETRPAAGAPTHPSRPPAPAPAAPVAASVPSDAPARWEEVLAAVRPKPGGAGIASALAHAAPIRLDAEAGVLELGFSLAKVFYRELLERAERAEALRESLKQVIGRDVEVRFVAGDERVAAPRPPAPRRTEAPEDEYHDEGALPLGAVPAARRRVADEGEVETVPARPTETAEPPPVKLNLDEEAVKAHPLVKLVVERFEGRVAGIRPQGRREE
ncbi:MAG: DNA polymerase III subunit gamma/tau [Planctomycetota bacterium]|nr:DNA polymerase III subunit gamma/tau [Planctomycetota bacterium]